MLTLDSGSPFVNLPWQVDQYSVFDFTLLDPHLSDLASMRRMIDEIHARGMVRRTPIASSIS